MLITFFKKSLLAVLLFCIALQGAIAQTQSAGDIAAAAGAAGYLGQSLDKQLPTNKGLNFSPKKPKQEVAAAKSGDSSTFFLKKITFSGFKKVPFSELSKEVEGYTNQTVTLSSVEKISSDLTQYINSKGYIVQVFAPPQEVKDGVLRLEITQANLGGIYFTEGENSTPLQEAPASVKRAQARAASYIYNQIPPGGVINLNALDKALVILNDQSSKTYTGTLKQGLDAGQTDLGLEAYRQNTVVGNVDVNNFGVQSTGRAQALAQLAIRDVLNLDESFSLGAIASQGTSFFKAGYSMPLASNGLRMSIDVNTLTYKTVSSAATPATGNSTSENLQFSYPAIASKEGITRLVAGISNRKFENNTYGTLVSAYSLKVATVGVNGNFYGSMLVPTVDVFSLNLLKGSMYGNKSESNYQSNITPSGYVSYVPNNYTKLSGIYAKSFFFTDQSSFRLAASGQLASANLNSAENFYVSGPDAVRAYMPSVAYGTQGFMVNADYNYEFKSGVGVGAFFDYAAVTQYKSATTASMINTSTAPNSYNISGAGVKASYKYKGVASVSAFAAKPLDNVNFPSLLATGGKPSYVVGVQGRITF